ncbi:hypothetical protein B0T26DRAFT_719849 [Lasiosphaeria miniovina]|uniref:Uncharacterized protein n=1 Tax=Lasiosphaeria miniovina TaxID=1954250 RepID=A0AA40DS66_9PEZI|nr:uncharacterized protein B0T26DRAFT_719849 [Lasiosphaeria miniovina]KAK0714199.1 hypothetical protein B0T26DRAFT_719849 [Lasiosphaeria miniovina]
MIKKHSRTSYPNALARSGLILHGAARRAPSTLSRSLQSPLRGKSNPLMRRRCYDTARDDPGPPQSSGVACLSALYACANPSARVSHARVLGRQHLKLTTRMSTLAASETDARQSQLRMNERPSRVRREEDGGGREQR